MARPQGCGRRRLLAACLGNEDVVRGPAAALTKRPAASSAAPRPAAPALRCAALPAAHLTAPRSVGKRTAHSGLSGAFCFAFRFYYTQGSITVCQSKTCYRLTANKTNGSRGQRLAAFSVTFLHSAEFNHARRVSFNDTCTQHVYLLKASENYPTKPLHKASDDLTSTAL